MIGVSACSNEKQDLSSAGPSEAKYECTGVVKSMDKTKPSIQIEHDEIKGLSPRGLPSLQCPPRRRSKASSRETE